VQENEAQEELSLYPNPAQDLIQLQLKGINEAASGLEIYNSASQLVHSKRPASQAFLQVDCANWSSGTYTIAGPIK